MIAKLGSFLSRWASRVVPDPFVLALFLTLVALAAAACRMASAPAPAGEIAWKLFEGWFSGFRGPAGLAFALQMCIVLVTGHALATSPAVQRAVERVALLPTSAASASALVALTACGTGIVHWGLGAIAGALLAREIGRHAAARGLKVHYPVLGAAAYAGMAVWHGGMSGSAPLKVAEQGHFAVGIAGVIPVSRTLLGTLNLVTTGALVVLIPLLCWAMTPRRDEELVGPDPSRVGALAPRAVEPIDSVPTWFVEHPLPGRVLGLAGLGVIALAFARGRLAFDLDAVNLIFLFLGMALQGSLRHYLDAIADGARGAGAIIVQYPFYFGILGILRAGGLIEWMSDAFIALANATTLPVLSFYSACVVNLFVPSGGGQWAVQGEILLRSGARLGVPPETTVMAFAYGDACTNMLQPFWALPLLAITGLKARDVIGYTAVICALMTAVVTVSLLVLGR